MQLIDLAEFNKNLILWVKPTKNELNGGQREEREVHEEYMQQQEQQQCENQHFKAVPAWVARTINAGIVGGSESNIKQLRHLKKSEPQHKSVVLINKYKNNARKNVNGTHESEEIEKKTDGQQSKFKFFELFARNALPMCSEVGIRTGNNVLTTTLKRIKMPRNKRRNRTRSRSRSDSSRGRDHRDYTRSRSRSYSYERDKKRRVDSSVSYNNSSYSNERNQRSRQHDRNTSAERRYKRSHRRSPGSNKRNRDRYKRHHSTHRHRDRDRKRERDRDERDVKREQDDRPSYASRDVSLCFNLLTLGSF
ncbi:hypothetical protein RUM43_003359 [Polyplax serrata]|uniref:Uncharacterized protein n=1 Tax=Polyplax serrata TaxID=468196 RepID=A0AAN8S5I0_POLSC